MSAMVRLIKAALFTPGSRGWGLPLLAWGEPGVGKSDIIESVGAEFGMHVEVLAPGERGEGAFGVTPVAMTTPKTGDTPSRSMITYPPPDWIEYFEDSDGAGIVFVDEINTAPPALQPALLGLVHARRLGSHYLGSRIRTMGAANPPEIAASGWNLSAPMANRFGHIDWGMPSVEEWNEWLLSHDPMMKPRPGDPSKIKAEEDRVLEEFPEPYARAKGLVSAFLMAERSLIHKRPSKSDPNASRAWPSHRSWDMATRAMASAQVHGLSEVEADNFVAAFVGAGVMTALASYRQHADLPDPAGVLSGKVKFTHSPDRLDRTMATLNSCTALLISMSQKAATDKKAVDALNAANELMWTKLLAPLISDAADLVIVAGKALMSAKLHTSKHATPVMAKLRPILEEAA